MREWRTVEMFAWRSARTAVGVDMRLPPGRWMSTWLTHAPEAENSDKLPKEYPGGRWLRPSLPAGYRGLNDVLSTTARSPGVSSAAMRAAFFSSGEWTSPHRSQLGEEGFAAELSRKQRATPAVARI